MIHVRRTCTSYRCTAYMYHSVNTPLSASNDVVSRKDVPFGVTKIFDGTNFRLKKALTMAMLTYKLRLIVIVHDRSPMKVV